MTEADLLYFRLHGTVVSPLSWFGEGEGGGMLPALTGENLVGLKLKPGAVVVIANCYGDVSPLALAFYQAGAAAVIAGPGPNYAAARRVIGADRLVRSLIGALKMGCDVPTALRAAKLHLAARIFRKADRDTLKFHILSKE